MKGALAVTLALAPLAAEPPIRGFPPARAAEQWKLEEKARALPEAARIRTYIERMSAEPHHAGSPGGRAVAEYALGLLKEWGLEAKIETFEALLPYPTRRSLVMTAPERFRAALAEPAITEDGDSADAGQLPTYNAYSASGNVKGEVVYVNYGVPDDYEWLDRQGISFKGRIVLARYGKSWRGTKVKVAQERGALGCLIYSDPRDDGFYQGDAYPIGPYRPPAGVQRGSVLDMPVHVGDPLSPGWASEKGSRRLSREQAATIMKIPALPISYEDAKPFLRNLGGPVAPESWRGALELTYHVGPGPAAARLRVESDWATRPVLNVMARIPGAVYPEQWVVYGNHHDAWVNGAQDPLSGAASLLETARALALLRKEGWQPKRSIVLALWDAEEFGLVGSTEWAEKHGRDLAEKAVVYLNSDSNSKGPISAGGSHTLEAFLSEVLRDVRDPATGASVIESRLPRSNARDAAGDFQLYSLGAGSDYVAFLHHLGIASANLGFGGGVGAGVYHSIYDSFAWYSRFGDPEFVYGRALSQVTITSILRLAEAPLLPFEFTGMAKALQRFVDELPKPAGKDATKLDVKELEGEIHRLAATAKSFEGDFAQVLRTWNGVPEDRVASVNRALYQTERALLAPGGLPARPWYKHQIYAPGVYTGYGVKTLPAVREAAEAGRWEEASAQAKVVAAAVRAFETGLQSVAAELRQLAR